MAFKENTLEFTTGGDGYYEGCWAKAKVTITTSGSKVTWKIVMSTPANNSGKIPLIRLDFSIDGTEIYSEYFENYGKGFPCMNGSSTSGSITLKDSKDTSIPVIFNMGLNFKQADKAQYKNSKTLTRTYYTDGGTPTVNIVDKGNNAFTISGTLGKSGTNNTLKSATLYYTTNGSTPTANNATKVALGNASGGSYSRTIAMPSTCTKVRAKVDCEYQYHTKSTETNKAVQFRYGPMHSVPEAIWPGKAEGKRLTNKGKISFVWYDPDWTLADNKANYLPKECLNGYRIRMHEWKKGESSAASIHIGVNSDDSRWYDTWENTWETANTLAYDATYTRSGNKNTCTVDPVKLGMVAGDRISIMVHGRYKTAGNPVFVWSNVIGSNAESVANSSPWAMFENEGIVNVKVDGEWKEGQVYVKANNEWKEAESVFTKVDGAWKESQ